VLGENVVLLNDGWGLLMPDPSGCQRNGI
jgi:hypothetical protein